VPVARTDAGEAGKSSVPASPAANLVRSSPFGSLRSPGGSLLKSGARRVQVPPARADGVFAGSTGSPFDAEDREEDEVCDAELEGLQEGARSLGASLAASRLGRPDRVATTGDESTTDTADEAEMEETDAFDAEGEPAALAFPGIRSGARRAVYDPSDDDEFYPCSFNDAPPSTGGSVVRLAAVRAHGGAKDGKGGAKVVTPVRRSVRTPTHRSASADRKQAERMQAERKPVAAMLAEVGYVYEPNEAIEGPPVMGKDRGAGAGGTAPTANLFDGVEEQEGLEQPPVPETAAPEPTPMDTGAAAAAPPAKPRARSKRGAPTEKAAEPTRRSTRLRTNH
jgi:hypothetical protein